jgi:small subunit ribosomal protein S6
LNKYELAVVYFPKFNENELENKIDEIKNIINKFGGEIIDIENVGKRYLAYTIKKQSEGIYYFISFDAPESLPRQLEENLRIKDDILRYLILKRTEKKIRKKIRLKAKDENLNNDDISIIENSKTVDSNVELNNDKSDSESVEKINVEND